MATSPGPNSSLESLGKYHDYLRDNYASGVDRFFSPTGSLDQFQKSVTVVANKTRDVVIARDVDDAVNKLRSVVDGGKGVFDLTAEPGSGKTSVLPFRFPTKKVVVALPTPFDAWCAFQIATGNATLKLKGLSLGSFSTAGVCYMDSYMAANMLLSGFMEYDILIVDECDSGKGVSGFLADVSVKDKLLIRMSASHGRTQSGPSKAFTVVEDSTLSDVRLGCSEFVRSFSSKIRGRTLILLPDAQSALEVAGLIENSQLITSAVGLGSVAAAFSDQHRDIVVVADDVCSRGLNLNLDVLVDSQLVTEHGVTRQLYEGELYQRKGRVGRNKLGWYISPGLATIRRKVCEADIVRSNVMRSVAGIDQDGPESCWISRELSEDLLCSPIEPFASDLFKGRLPISGSTSLDGVVAPFAKGQPFSASPRTSDKSSKGRSRRLSGPDKVSSPSWMGWLLPVEQVCGKSFYVSESRYGQRVSVDRDQDTNVMAVKGKHRRRHSKDLSIAPDAPYAIVSRDKAPLTSLAASLPPPMPPVIDLSALEYEMDWPSAIRDCISRGLDIPSIVPSGHWRHTSVSGMGTDWFLRLDAIAVGDMSFTEAEFEVVCRAWNRLAALSWVKRTPGLSSLGNEDRLEFCLRYFQSYGQISAT